MSARKVATEVLRRVAVDGAWASRSLDAEIARENLDSRDAALATTIVYGALRRLPSIDQEIDQRAKKTDPLVRAILRAAVFQILHLDRVPVHAVVHETVSLARRARGKRVGGFVNAVLRRIQRPDPIAPATLQLPPWIAQRLVDAVGEERAAAFDGGQAPLDLRLFVDRDAWLAELPAEVKGTPFGPYGVRIAGGGDPRLLHGFDDGAFVVQEAGSQRIVDLVDAQEGQRIADVCAGRGGKSVGLAQAIGDDGSLCAIELHEARLEQIPDALSRVGLKPDLTLETIDLTVGNGGLDATFDRVLVDAPCSGLGTVHRRPEILLRLKEKDLRALACTQGAILENAASLVGVGGTLIFAVCSFATEEGPGATAAFEKAHPEFEVCAGDGADPDGGWRLGPWSDTDSYQVRRYRRLR